MSRQARFGFVVFQYFWQLLARYPTKTELFVLWTVYANASQSCVRRHYITTFSKGVLTARETAWHRKRRLRWCQRPLQCRKCRLQRRHDTHFCDAAKGVRIVANAVSDCNKSSLWRSKYHLRHRKRRLLCQKVPLAAGTPLDSRLENIDDRDCFMLRRSSAEKQLRRTSSLWQQKLLNKQQRPAIDFSTGAFLFFGKP